MWVSQMANDWVVIYYPTIMDGKVLRWYRSVEAAENGAEVVNASRNGVTVPGLVTMADKPLIEHAFSVHQQLAANRDADVTEFVTHTKAFFGREVRPVAAS